MFRFWRSRVPAAAGVTAGDGSEMGGSGVGGGVDGGGAGGAGAGQDLEVQAGSRKRKAAAMSKDSNSLARNGDLELDSENIHSISTEIKKLRSHVDGVVKELGYSEENKKLWVEMDCLKKQNEELQVKHECLRKNIMEILETQIDAKRKQLQQLEGFYSTMGFPLTWFEEDKRILDKSCDEDSESNTSEESAIYGKADDKKLLELAELDAEIQIKMDKLGGMLESENLFEEVGSATVWKSIQTNQELQEIRKELIAHFYCDTVKHGHFGVKRMGELDYLSLIKAFPQKLGHDKDDLGLRTLMLASYWDGEVKNPSWHPFKMVEADGRLKEVVDEDDEKLKQLRAEHGVDVCNVVKTALVELNEYNPSGRFSVPELWNFSEGRKATTKEVVGQVIKELRVACEAQAEA